MATNKKNKKLSKKAILAEARQLFSSKGYRATTLQDLTSSFGVSRPSLYYYFKNKMELLLELHSQGYDKAVKSFEDILISKMPTREKFRKILEVHTRNLASEAEIHKIFFQDENEMPDKLVREIRKRRREYTNRIIEIYQRGIDEGIFREMDPKTVVYLLLGACNWITMWYSPAKRIDPETMVQYLLTLLCEGYEK
jgi:AcrR family transcriptional regulator